VIEFVCKCSQLPFLFPAYLFAGNRKVCLQRTLEIEIEIIIILIIGTAAVDIDGPLSADTAHTALLKNHFSAVGTVELSIGENRV